MILIVEEVLPLDKNGQGFLAILYTAISQESGCEVFNTTNELHMKIAFNFLL